MMRQTLIRKRKIASTCRLLRRRLGGYNPLLACICLASYPREVSPSLVEIFGRVCLCLSKPAYAALPRDAVTLRYNQMIVGLIPRLHMLIAWSLDSMPMCLGLSVGLKSRQSW